MKYAKLIWKGLEQCRRQINKDTIKNRIYEEFYLVKIIGSCLIFYK